MDYGIDRAMNFLLVLPLPRCECARIRGSGFVIRDGPLSFPNISRKSISQGMNGKSRNIFVCRICREINSMLSFIIIFQKNFQINNRLIRILLYI